MAKKGGSEFVCQNCGSVYPKWQGKCDACGEWNTIVEEKVGGEGFSNLTPKKKGRILEFVPLSGAETALSRIPTGIKELDRVSGGGLVPGSAILVGGDPGIGKSTLLLQVCASIANAPSKPECYYISGEEAIDQVRIRAKRLGLEQSPVNLASTTDVKDIIETLDKSDAAVVIIDSIQTMYLEEVESTPGSVAQVRACAYELIKLAKKKGFVLFLVGHVTKQGAIAGPRVLEHMVDTVLYFEGDRQDSFRLLRSVKNRFGSTDEIGVFEMRSTGMAEISDPSTLFITGTNLPGCAVTCAMEGTRPMMVEVQALLSTSPFSNPRRMAAGLDNNRLVLLLAVLEKKAGLRFHDKDVYTNVVGGIRLDERACDLAVAMCIAGAGADIALPPRTAILGELSLTGEVRPVNRLDKRIQECARLGFSHIVVPNSDTLPKVDGLNYTRVKNIREALCILGI